MSAGTARKGFTEKVKFVLYVKVGKDSEERRGGWTFIMKGSAEAGLSSAQSIQGLGAEWLRSGGTGQSACREASKEH